MSRTAPSRARIGPGWRAAAIVVALGIVSAACGAQTAPTASATAPTATAPTATSTEPGASGIHLIKHVIVIMQENRSFDSYFGTYPGADGIPMQNGVPTVCVPDPGEGGCRRPYHDPNDKNFGGPHAAANAVGDINGGQMNGFIGEAQKQLTATCAGPFDPTCVHTNRPTDVMGYHDAREIPNYWTYAQQFVLQDHMFESNASWSLPAHLYMVSAWSALCAIQGDPMSCTTNLDSPAAVRAPGPQFPPVQPRPDYAWTDITYLLHKYNVSWRYYIAQGTQPDCYNDAETCTARPQRVGTPEIWNPLPYFDTVHADGQIANIQPLTQFYADARNGTLPDVTWVVPNGKTSEHPPALVSNGQAYVTGLVLHRDLPRLG